MITNVENKKNGIGKSFLLNLENTMNNDTGKIQFSAKSEKLIVRLVVNNCVSIAIAKS